MRIVVLRHGRPDIDSRVRLTAAEFGAWIKQYDSAGIRDDSVPPQSAVSQVGQCAFVVCSNLPRSLGSAKALGVEHIGVCDASFREVEMPYAHWRFPRIPVTIWLAVFRVMWTLGYSANAEPFKVAKARARDCANRLAELAAIHGAVLFVGHGSLNWLIARQLEAMGWSGPRKAPRKHWEFGVYRNHTAGMQGDKGKDRWSRV